MRLSLLLSLFLPPDDEAAIHLPDTTLFYHEPGRVSVPEPGISLCQGRGGSCNRHYTPTPLSHGLCERCRRKEKIIVIEREVAAARQEDRRVDDRVVRFSRRAKA